MADPEPIQRLNVALEGRYRIERELGAGGMATVYLAEDVRHRRDIALKVLKPELAAVVGSDRFLAEIETTAKLQHPHILGLHDSGEADGLPFYVMPYVEGESLRDRLDREHQLPVDDAVQIGTDLAEALDYAHRRGVIHRDIKPANVLLQNGKPVISDFGIALAVDAAGGGRLTETGLSLGTPHYMSPEQATGDPNVGPATDIWALGCVLYEMLVGEPPFTGSTLQAVLGKIVTESPPRVREHRRSVPPNVEATLLRALEKVPADRFPSAEDMCRALAQPGFRHGSLLQSNDRAAGRRWARAATVALVAAFAGGVIGWSLSSSRRAPLQMLWLPDPFFEGQKPSPLDEIRLTPDGSAVVFVGPNDAEDGRQLWVRRWTELEARRLPGTDITDRVSFAVSPDGREVVWLPYGGAQTTLRITPLDGGPSRSLSARGVGVSAWHSDGMIYFHRTAGRAVQTVRVPASGGVVEPVSAAEANEWHLAYVPLGSDGRGVLEVRSQSNPWAASSELWLQEAGAGSRRRLVAGHTPRITATGRLLYVTVDGGLRAADLDRAGTMRDDAGSAVILEDEIMMDPVLGRARYDVSQTGTLVYTTGMSAMGTNEFVWVDRAGQVSALPFERRFSHGGVPNVGWSLSPDHTRLAYQKIVEGNVDIYVLSMEDGAEARLTFDPAADIDPRWSPDGSSVVFYSERGAGPLSGQIWERSADGRGDARPLVPGVHAVEAVWSPDGEWLLLRTVNRSDDPPDILGVRPAEDSIPVPLVTSDDVAEYGIAISPDGRWLAYESNETGRQEVFVRPLPNVAEGKWQVSADGGSDPAWAHNGRELFFREGDDLVAAEYRAGATFQVIDRRRLFVIPETFSRPYDVSGDDGRFLMLRNRFTGSEDATTILVTGFVQDLEGSSPR